MDRVLNAAASSLQLVRIIALVLVALPMPAVALAGTSGPDCVSPVTCDSGCRTRLQMQCVQGTSGCKLATMLGCTIYCACEPGQTGPPYCDAISHELRVALAPSVFPTILG